MTALLPDSCRSTPTKAGGDKTSLFELYLKDMNKGKRVALIKHRRKRKKLEEKRKVEKSRT
jgi:hypothetical protein